VELITPFNVDALVTDLSRIGLEYILEHVLNANGHDRLLAHEGQSLT
jgi:hypothetical protein